MKLIRLVALLAMLGFTAVPAGAQVVIGRAMIDGKMIELLEDNTWRYVDLSPGAQAAQCREVHAFLSFCGSPVDWKSTPPPTPDVKAAYRYDDSHYSQYVIENLGSENGFSYDFMRMAVISNAAAAIGLDESEIVFIDLFESEIDGNPAETMVYMFNYSGLNVVYENTYFVGRNVTVQAMTYAIAPDFEDEQNTIHEAFLAATKLNLPGEL